MLHFTSNQGFEDIVINELQSFFAAEGLTPGEFEASPFGIRGNVFYRPPVAEKAPGAQAAREEELLPFIPRMRSIYHCDRYLDHVQFETEDFFAELESFFGALQIPSMEEASSFRVRCNRRGNHPFHSPDVERLAGAVLQKRYGTEVDLEEPDCDVRIEIFQTHLFAGERISEPRAERRFDKVFHQRVSTRSVVAYGMLNLAGILSKPGTLLDPFCGSGTILLEAADLLPGIELYGCDHHEDAVEGTEENLRRLGAMERSSIFRADARDISEYLAPSSISYIVTDPPLGIKMGKRINFYTLYSTFLTEAHRVLEPGGRLLMLSQRHRKLFNYALRDVGGFTLKHVRVIEYGGIYPALFLLQKA